MHNTHLNAEPPQGHVVVRAVGYVAEAVSDVAPPLYALEASDWQRFGCERGLYHRRLSLHPIWYTLNCSMCARLAHASPSPTPSVRKSDDRLALLFQVEFAESAARPLILEPCHALRTALHID